VLRRVVFRLGQTEPVARVVPEQRLDPVGSFGRFLEEGHPLRLEIGVRRPAVVGLASCGSLWLTPTAPPGDWEAILPSPDVPEINGGVKRSAVDATADVYAGTSAGELYAGVGGAGWQRVFDALTLLEEVRSVVDIEVDLDDPATVYLGLTGDDAGRVVLLRRGAAGLAMTAKDITGDLPSGVAVTALAVDRMNAQTIYAGTWNRGVYRGRYVKTSDSWTWDVYGTGMPSAAGIEALIVHPRTGVMRAGTCGRGAYEVNTDHPVGSVLSIEGVPIYLRVHDSGGYGPPTDRIDGEVVVRLDTEPLKAFGFPLRADGGEDAHVGMLRLLRSAFVAGARVRIDYERTGLRNGRAIRVMQLHGQSRGGKKPVAAASSR
jgi:hypothetical protein